MNEEPSDSTLLRQYSMMSDNAAFTQLCERYTALFYHASLRQMGGNTHDAAEVSQLVFSLLADKSGLLKHHKNLAGWLHVTTRFVVQRIKRREQRRLQREYQAFVLDEITSMHPAENHQAELSPLIDAAVADLGELDRNVVLLRYEMKQTFAQVGSRVGLSENATRMRVDRALEKLRRAFAKRGISSTAAAIGTFISVQAQAEVPAGFAKAVAAAALVPSVQAAALSTTFFILTMSTSKTIMAVSLCLCAAGISTALFEASAASRLRKELRASVADAAITTSDLKSRLARAHEESRLAAANVAALQAGSSIKTVQAAAVGTPTPKEETEAEFDKLVANSPELQQLYVRQMTIRLRSRFGPLYRQLHLTPEQVRSFEKIMSDQAQAKIDVPVSAVAQGLSKNDPSVKMLLEQAQKQRDMGLQNLLGVSGFSDFQNYDRTADFRGVTNNLAGNLFWTEEPLTLEQSNQLTQILANSSEHDGNAVNFDSAISAAKGVLSPTQIGVLQNMKDQMDLGLQVQKTLAERRAIEAQKKSPITKSESPITALK